MSRKDYVAIAAIICTIANDVERARIAIAIARIMQADNPGFRPGKFLAACHCLMTVPS